MNIKETKQEIEKLMGERNSISQRNDMAITPKARDLIAVVFSWSLEDICNQDFYKDKVCFYNFF